MSQKNVFNIKSTASELVWVTAVLNSVPDTEFDLILETALTMCSTPIAVFSQTGTNKKWVKFSNDAKAVDLASRFLFSREIPVHTPGGTLFGHLIVSDISTRTLPDTQIAGLNLLALQITKWIELKAQAKSSTIDERKSEFSISAMDNISDGIVTQDATGAIVYSNPAAQVTLGLNAEELNGKHSTDPVWKPLHEDGTEFPGVDLPPMTCLRTGKKVSDVILGIHRGKDNSVRWLNVNAVPLFAEGAVDGDKPIQVVTSFTDITEQINIKRQTRDSEKELRFILNSIPAIIGHWDKNLINIDSNDAYSKFLNVPPENIKGKHFKDVLGENLYELNRPNFEEVFKGNRVHFLRTLKGSDGSDMHFDGTYVPHVVDGRVVSFLTILVDITRLKKNELERQSLETKLTEASRLSALGELAAGIAHEVNNPLGIIMGRVSQLKEKFEAKTINPETDMKYITALENTSERIAKIVKGLRTYSRNAENDPFDPIRIRGIVDDTVELCRERLKVGSIELTIQCPDDLTMDCRPAQISQVLMNLITNSCDALQSLKERWIRMEVYNSGPNVHIKCVDSGNGIPADIAEKIMQPFFTTKIVGKGTGLGLSVSMGIAHCHNGKFIYKPNEKNTTFILEVPKHHIENKVVTTTAAPLTKAA